MTDSNFNYISKNYINKAIMLSCWRLLSLKEKWVKETSVQVQPQKNIECIQDLGAVDKRKSTYNLKSLFGVAGAA